MAMSLAFVSGCQRPYEMDYDFALNRDQLRFPKGESKAYFLVYSKSSWTVDFETPVEWARLSRTEGTGNGQVMVMCDANDAASRGVNIIVTNNDGTTKIIYLSQQSVISEGEKDEYVYKLKDSKINLLRKGTSVSVGVSTKIPDSMFEGITYRLEPESAADWIKDVNATASGITCVVDDYVGTEGREAVVGVYFPAAEWDETRITAFLTISQSPDVAQIILEDTYSIAPFVNDPVSIPLDFNWDMQQYSYDYSSFTFSDDSWLDVEKCSFDPVSKSVRVMPTWNRGGQPRTTVLTCVLKDEVGNIVNETSTSLVQDTPKALYEGEKFANCYMVEKTQAVTYWFDAKKPDGSLPAENMASAEILWQNVACPLDRAFYEDGRIYFTTVAGKNGNAVIVVKDADGVIRWSWHIWVLGEALGTNTFNSTSAGVAPYVFMDRNLGATTRTGRTAAGLHYQYGRKDPFPSADPADYSSTNTNQNRISVTPDDAIGTEVHEEGVTIDWTIQHPGVYVWGSVIEQGPEDWLSSQRTGLWGNATTKSIYDPCPYGWKVPAKNAYRNSDWWNNMQSSGSGVMTVGVGATCNDSNGKEAYYLFSGRWRRTAADTHIAHAGTYCYLWTCSESSGLNTDYKGTWHIRVRDKSGSLSRGEEEKQPRRWGANVRCVKIN